MNISIEEKELFDALHNERVQDIKTFNKPDYKGLWGGVIDKYKEKAHFIYELIQNADDVEASRVEFKLEKDKLLFRHNGKIKFSISSVDDTKNKGHINAITAIGNSTKDESKGNTIGKFGVGFKAVFQYTKEPRIYDDKFWFKIEQFIIPTELSFDFKDRKKGETVFEFPFSSPQIAYSEIKERLQNLNNPILFLQNLKKINVTITGEDDIIYSKKLIESNEHGNIKHELFSIKNNKLSQKLHLFTKNVVIDDEKGKEISQYISAGYFLKNNGDIDTSNDQKVFCFFPTAENFRLKCVVHAPFLLVDNRQQLKEENLNYELKNLLAKLASEALPILRDYGSRSGHNLITENIFDIVPVEDYSWDNPDNTFRDAYIRVLRKEKLFLARKDKYISCKEALISHPLSLMNIISDKQLTCLKNENNDEKIHKWHFLREETQKIYEQAYVKSILDELNVEKYYGKTLAVDITPSFMEKEGIKWAKRLYTHLRNEQVGLYKRLENSKKKIAETPFCLSPIILSNSKEWVPAYLENGKLNIFLPLASEAKGYKFISNEYDGQKDCLAFFKDMGIKQPNTWDYIQSVLLKKYDEELNIDYEELKSDFEFIYLYIKENPNEQNKLEEISKTFGVLTTKETYCATSEVYDNTEVLNEYFKDQDKDFIDYNFYQEFINKYSKLEFLDFIYSLGVSRVPRAITSKRYNFDYNEIQKYKINRYTWCSIDDCFLDGFNEWSPKSINTSKVIWEHMSNLKEYKEVDCTYQYYSYYPIKITSTIFKEFANRKWIITKNGKILKPSEVTLEELEEAEYKIDYELNRYFGIERKVKSLKELGATDDQIEQNKLGRIASQYGIDSEEKMAKACEALAEKERREAINTIPNNPHPNNKIGNNSEFLHNKQRKTSLCEMSSSQKEYNKNKQTNVRELEDKVNDLVQKLSDEANKRIEEANKRAGISEICKYTKKWFTDLLDLEYSSPNNNEINYTRKTTKIVFEKFRKEPNTDSIYLLTNPSRNIPMWLEEIGGLHITFTFFNQDELKLVFEVANVKDFTLRVKAKNADISQIDKIDWSKCTKAILEINNPVEIIGRLKDAFDSFEYNDDFNFKENLSNNVSFVFGPPGTGKTTRLAEIITSKMKHNKCKILVLAPTNKACDVLCSRLMINQKEGCTWLGRFVATGDENIESSGFLIDRDSDLWRQEKCCVISTIARLPYDSFTSNEKNGLLKNINWDYVIIDEASMIPLVQIVYAIYKMKTSKFIIAGDPLQIAPIVSEKAWIGENIYTMVNLNNFENPKTEPIQFAIEKLNTQYRSIPTIGDLYSKYSYDGKLQHNRTNSQIKDINLGSIDAKAITLIPFRVERFDSIFGAKKLQGSNVHIYSVLFAVEMTAYIAKQQKENIRIGVICPYSAQAQLINKMIEQRTDIPEFVEVIVGTIHGFQGDQCEIIISVFNPPTGINSAAERIMLNNKNIINVAISRASDFLFILLPHPDSYGYHNLVELNKLCSLLVDEEHNVTLINSEDIEKAIFDNIHYIESNTFVTNHQTANVYTKASNNYEVRIDENAVDIQLSGQKYEHNSKN